MILRLDPRWPLVWRTPTSVQLGVDPPVVVLDPVTELEERLLAALAVGVSESGLSMIARGHDGVRASLLERIAPALEPREAAPIAPAIAIVGVRPFGAELEALLLTRGVRVIAPAGPERPDLAVVVSHHVIPPDQQAYWLRRDVPHLPVVFTDRAVHVGPVVEPGAGPCLLCLELHHRDADPAWPAIASQLLGRVGTSESALTGREAAVVAARLILTRVSSGPATQHTVVRIDAETGARETTAVEAHPDCGCRGIAGLVTAVGHPPAQPESDSAAATRRAIRTPPGSPPS